MHLLYFQLGQFLVELGIQDLNVGSLHSQRPGFDDTGALQLSQGVDDDGPGDAGPIGNFTGYQKTFVAIKFLKNLLYGFHFRIG